MANTYRSQHEDAKKFLKNLCGYLAKHIRPPDEVRQHVANAVLEAKSTAKGSAARSEAFPEGAFLNKFVTRNIHDFLQREMHFTDDQAREALLSESFRSLPEISSGTPASTLKHPFTKVLGDGAPSIIRRWWNPSTKSGVHQSCPDIALRSPCPFKTVFEGKYFTRGGVDAAKTEIVAGIYQCFYYLALPRTEQTRERAGWDYDFACFLIYDATESGSVLTAWNHVKQEVSEGCWEGANIFVMILGSAPAL